jgi:hypothetical protein
MKKQLIFTATLIIFSALTMAINSEAQNSAPNSNEFTVPLSDPAKRGKLKAHINYGSITVKGSARKDILVRYKTTDDNEDPKASTKGGLKRIGGGGLDLEVAESENNVKISSNSWNHKLELEVEVPVGMDLDVKTYNDGDLFVSNIQGEIVLTNYNGEITANNISGSVMATTYNGDIKVTFDKVTAATPMSYSTYNGDIDIALPAAHKASLKMKTERGDIYSDFDVAFKSTGPVQQKDTKAGVYKVVVDDWKRGDINGGGAEMTMKNYNGDIFVRRK